jgi:hypothetical protein
MTAVPDVSLKFHLFFQIWKQFSDVDSMNERKVDLIVGIIRTLKQDFQS